MKKIIFLILVSCFYVSSAFADLIVDSNCDNYNLKCYNDCLVKHSGSPIYYGGICKDECCNLFDAPDISFKQLSIIYIFTIITLLLVMYYYPKIKNKSKIKQ